MRPRVYARRHNPQTQEFSLDGRRGDDDDDEDDDD
jgi:hypothetical protein